MGVLTRGELLNRSTLMPVERAYFEAIRILSKCAPSLLSRSSISASTVPGSNFPFPFFFPAAIPVSISILSSLESSLVPSLCVRVRASFCILLTAFMAWPEEFFYQLMSYFAAQLSSFDHGVVIMEASIDSGGFHFLHQVICTVVSMRGGGDKAVYGELHSLRTEIARENCLDRAVDAAVCSGGLRMGGSRFQRRPCYGAHALRIAASRT